MNVAELWQKQAAKYGDKVFLYFGDDEYSYKQMLATFYRVADSLAGLGVTKGDRVALMHRNAPEFLYTWFALSFLGAITVPINPVFTETEIAYILGHSGAKALVIEDEFLPTLAKVPQAEMPEMKQVIVSGGQAPEGTIPFAQLLEGQEMDPGVAIDDQDPCVCIYTSGTTDMPKGVLNSHYGWVTTGQSYAYTVGIGENDRVMTPNPLFHANAQVYSTMGSLNAGAGLILLERFSGSQILEQARHYQGHQDGAGAGGDALGVGPPGVRGRLPARAGHHGGGQRAGGHLPQVRGALLPEDSDHLLAHRGHHGGDGPPCPAPCPASRAASGCPWSTRTPR